MTLINTQDFVYLEFVKYRLGLRRNMQVFAKCNVYIPAIQLFYIQECQTAFQNQDKLYIFPIVGLIIFLKWSSYYLSVNGVNS